MENQHRKINGYRELCQEEIDLMNEIKAKGEELKALCRKVQLRIHDQFNAARHPDRSKVPPEDAQAELDRLYAADPQTWLEEGHHDMQTALMKITRAVAQPTTF